LIIAEIYFSLEDLHFELLTPEDSNLIIELRELAILIFERTFARTVSTEQMQDYLDNSLSLEQFKIELQHPESYFYLIGYAGKWIAYIKLNIGAAQTEVRPEGQLEIQRFYLHPDYHRKGIAQIMMRYCEHLAKTKSLNTIWLGVAEDNTPALKFYLKEGFIKTGMHPFDFAGEVQWDWCVEKHLDT
jgi:ribosomal protein S18 acetylase RimI-like enzyme